MLYKLGRLFQLVGLLILPLAIAGNLAPNQPLDLRSSLTLSGVGIGVFALGWLIQQAGKRG
jgi:uncharacterized membrane protein YGL010W